MILIDKKVKAEFLGEGKLSIRSRFWEVVHDPKKGGCITSIRFLNGSDENILVNPISSYFGSFWDILDDGATVTLNEGDGQIEVRVKGELRDANKHTMPFIKFEYAYEYREGHIKITRKYSLQKDIAGLSEIGIGCMDVASGLNSYAARPSHVGADKSYATCVAKWGQVDANGKGAFEERNIPLYMAVFHKGVEGIEFAPGADLEEWTGQLIGKRDQGRFQIRGEPGGVRIVIEPFSSSVGSYAGIQLSGEYAFSSYIGLPMIPEKVPRKYMHMAFGNHPWPSDEDIRRWAFSGVNVVRLHNDYHPSGDFWHDGSWPPYDEKGMAELKRVIESCHKYGMKVVPYFSLYEINPKSEAFAEGYITWRRTVDESGSLIETYPPNQYYGFVMCLRSGWKDFLKAYVRKVVKTFGFDGIYYDYSQYYFCNNKLHSKGDHTFIDDLIDFLEYTRGMLGEDGIMLLHQSAWWPSVLIENYSDGHIMFEDNVHWKEIPPIEEFPPNASHITFMNVAPKIPCPITGVPDMVKGYWDFCAKCSVLGAFPWGIGPEAHPLLALFEAFRAFDLSRFKFRDYTGGDVKTDDEAIKASIYFNEERALVVLANVTDGAVKSFRWTLDPGRVGQDASQRYHVTGSLGDSIRELEGKDLAINGIEDSLGGFRFKAYAITRYHSEIKCVLYNTRLWNDSHIGDKLTVETKGPIDQESTLIFYSPEKPKEIRMDSSTLGENKDWTWDGATQIGRVTYRYSNSDAKVIIEIL
jgi:hypothetical protein